MKEQQRLKSFIGDLASVLKKHRAGLSYTTDDDGLHVSFDGDIKSVGAIGIPSDGTSPEIERFLGEEKPNGYPLPIIHSNGTGIRMLTEGYDDARAKLRAARAAFDQIEFNGRDYYIHADAGAFHSARSAREEIAAKFDEIATYLNTHLEHLEDPRAEAEKQSPANGGTAAHRRR